MNNEIPLEFLQVFVSESREMIGDVEPVLIRILEDASETGEVDLDSLNAIFRLFHSMKGSAGSLGLSNIASLTHKAETLLDLFREGKAEIDSDHVDVLLRTLDLSGLYLDKIELEQNDSGYEDEKMKLVKELGAAIDKAKGGKKAASSSETKLKADSLPVPGKKTEDSVVETPSLINKEIAEQFGQEATDILDDCEKVLLEIEEEPDLTGKLAKEVYRNIHSFKGNCGFLGLGEMEDLSHRVENILDSIISLELNLAPEQIMTLLMTVDSLRQAVNDFKSGGKGSVEGFDTMLDFVDQVAKEIHDSHPKRIGEILVDEGKIKEDDLQQALEKQKKPIGKLLVEMGAVDPDSVNSAAQKQAQQINKSSKRQIHRSDIRVDLNKLDQLVNLIGELVIAETMVTRNPDLNGLALENFEKSVHHLRRVTSNLQDVAMNIRMIPLSATFQKLVRVVHDISRRDNKQVKLNLVGEETEIDKTMTEQLADPLLHMVRNSVDHGIEPSEERLAMGKSEAGNVTIEARYEGGEVWIIVSDDGRGLNREKILAKAVEKGLISSQADTSGLKDEEVFDLIFAPGFSTAATVSEISGRGVGMDVVKKNIEKLKGRITVRSRLGHGTSIYLQIPLTLAIIDGMLIRVGDSSYTIPLLSIRESLQPLESSITHSPDGQEIVRIREELIPVVRIAELHGKIPENSELHKGILVIVEDRGKKIALFVDEILGQQQTVVKGLSKYFAAVKGVSGCTILGDGAVSLILDVSGLVEKAGSKFNEYNR